MKGKQRKLLILGGNDLSADIVTKAREMGIHTTVIDWNDLEHSPAKQISDEHHEISIRDYDKVMQLIKEKGIDGVITGFTDSYLRIYARICEMASLPAYASEEDFHWTLDKNLFKDKCRLHGVPVVPEFSAAAIVEERKLPCDKVILKPVDNSGSRGIKVVEDYGTFAESYNESMGYSKKGQVLVERYMDCDDVSLCYTLRDGEISLSAICDRYIHKTPHNGSVTSGLIYPSKYLGAYLEKVDGKVREMFRRENLRNGVLFMQAFVEDGEFYFYEMGYRLSGGRHYIFTEAENGVSALEEMIGFAVSGKMNRDNTLKDRADFSSVYSQLCVLCREERIGSIEGLEWLNNNPNIIDSAIRYKVGDVVGTQGTTMQIVARIHIKASDMGELKSVLESVRNEFRVLNEDGEDMVEDFFCPLS